MYAQTHLMMKQPYTAVTNAFIFTSSTTSGFSSASARLLRRAERSPSSRSSQWRSHVTPGTLISHSETTACSSTCPQERVPVQSNGAPHATRTASFFKNFFFKINWKRNFILELKWQAWGLNLSKCSMFSYLQHGMHQLHNCYLLNSVSVCIEKKVTDMIQSLLNKERPCSLKSGWRWSRVMYFLHSFIYLHILYIQIYVYTVHEGVLLWRCQNFKQHTPDVCYMTSHLNDSHINFFLITEWALIMMIYYIIYIMLQLGRKSAVSMWHYETRGHCKVAVIYIFKKILPYVVSIMHPVMNWRPICGEFSCLTPSIPGIGSRSTTTLTSSCR